MKDYIGYVIIGIIFFAIGFFVVSGIIDIITGDFHIYNYVDMSSVAKYRVKDIFIVSDRKEFTGSYADYSPVERLVTFGIENVTKSPYDFEGANFGLVTKDRKMFILNVIDNGNYILNPDTQLRVTCEIPYGIEYADIKGFRIWKNESKHDVSMRFGYLPAPFWKVFYEEHLKGIFKLADKK